MSVGLEQEPGRYGVTSPCNRVLSLDAHGLFGAFLRTALRQRGVIAEQIASAVESALERFPPDDTGLALLDPHLPEIGDELLRGAPGFRARRRPRKPVMTEAQRRIWLTRHSSHRAAERELSQRLDRLSAREREVLDLLCRGYRAAAATLSDVPLSTTRAEIRSIIAKLEVTSQLQAVALVRSLHQL